MTLIRSLWFHIAIYAQYAKQNLKVKMSYPWDFFVSLVGTLVYGVLNVTFLWVLLQKTPDIVGWTFAELVFLYGFGEITFGLFAIFFFHALMRLSEHYIVEGNLDRPLVRPISPLMQIMMENMDLFDIVILLKGGVLIAWAWGQIDLAFNFANLAGLLFGLTAGAFVYFGCFLLIGSVSFLFPDRAGLLMPLLSVSDVSRYPITAYPLAIRIFFSYIIPFAFVAFYPSVWLLDKGLVNDSLILYCALAAFVMMALGIFAFRYGLKHYQSTGT